MKTIRVFLVFFLVLISIPALSQTAPLPGMTNVMIFVDSFMGSGKTGFPADVISLKKGVLKFWFGGKDFDYSGNFSILLTTPRQHKNPYFGLGSPEIVKLLILEDFMKGETDGTIPLQNATIWEKSDGYVVATALDKEWIFSDHFQDCSQFAGADEFARLLHHRIAGVIVRERKHFSGPAHGFAQRLRLPQVQRQRLIAYYVEAFFKKGCRNRRMQIIRRDDGDKINPFVRRQHCFALCHFRVGGVNALWIQEKLLASRLGVVWIGGKTTGHQFNLAINIRGHAMDSANKGALAAADHAVTKFAFHRLFLYPELTQINTN
jgi:hypothetical protein